MKLQKMALTFALAAASVPTMAQYEGTSVYDRIGHGQDSIDVLNSLVLYRDYYKAKDWASAYEPWKLVLTKAPFAQVGVYAYGAAILGNLIVSTTDMNQKKAYFNELMDLYDTRLKNLDGLNSFTSERSQATKGDVVARKAFDYAYYGQGVADDFSIDKAYSMFREGIAMIREEGAKEIPGFVLDKFFDISYQKYVADNQGFRANFLQDYLESKEVCEKMLELANQAQDQKTAQQIVAQYDPTLSRIETIFAQSKAADKEQIIAIFTPKVEENKGNLAYLKSALVLLASNDCDDTDVYYKAAEYAYQIESSYESAIGMAQKLNKAGKTAESVQYYDKALELCKTESTKASISLKIASALAKSGDINGAFGYLDKAISFNNAVTGKSYLLRAQFLARQKKFAEAVNYCTKAAEADISISGTAERFKANLIDVQRKNAEYEKANAVYQAEKAKRQKEEDFWKAGQ